MAAPHPVPHKFSGLFWDHDFNRLSWDEHRNFIIRRFLQHGSWEAVTWLRAHVGDASLREWLKEHEGGKLSPRQLRFWELVLDIEHQRVNRWIEIGSNNPWSRRGAK